MAEETKPRVKELDMDSQLKEIETAIANKWGLGKKASKTGRQTLMAVLGETRHSERAKATYLKYVAAKGVRAWSRRMERYAKGQGRRPIIAGGFGTWYEPADIPATQGQRGYSEPVQLFDTHPNRRFAEGDIVAYLGPDGRASMIATGEVIGHAGEDRVYVQWPTFASQEDTDELIRIQETVPYAEYHDKGPAKRPTQMLAGREKEAYGIPPGDNSGRSLSRQHKESPSYPWFADERPTPEQENTAYGYLNSFDAPPVSSDDLADEQHGKLQQYSEQNPHLRYIPPSKEKVREDWRRKAPARHPAEPQQRFETASTMVAGDCLDDSFEDDNVLELEPSGSAASYD